MNRECMAETPLHVRLQGRGRPRLMWIHGFGDGGFVWNPVLLNLQPRASALLDLRGHGDSPWDSLQRYAADDHFRDAYGAFESLDLDDVVLVGHSLGAEIALRLADHFRDRVRGLALVDWGPDPNPHGKAMVRQQFTCQRRQYASTVEYVAVLAERLPLAHRSVLASYASNALREVASGVLELKCDPALAFPVQDPDPHTLRACLASLACPVLLVRGAISGVLPQALAQRVAAETPRCRLAVVANAGHAVPLDNPEGLASVLDEFLAQLDLEPAGASNHGAAALAAFPD